MLIKIFSKVPVLETPRLILRKMSINDTRDMYDYARHEEVTRYLLWDAHSSIEYTRRYLQHLQNQYRLGEYYDWAVVYRENGVMIGTCGFTSFDLANNRAEIGYVLNPRYWGMNLTPEAVSAVLEFAFHTLGLNRVEARYMSGNLRSRRVMEKCGMTYEGMQRSLLYVKGQYRDIGICSILYSEYAAMYQNKAAQYSSAAESKQKRAENKIREWLDR